MIKTTAQLQQRFVEISEDNSFPKNFGTGENLIGLPPNDIYQLGFAAAFFECNRAVNQYVNAQALRTCECGHSEKEHDLYDAVTRERMDCLTGVYKGMEMNVQICPCNKFRLKGE